MTVSCILGIVGLYEVSRFSIELNTLLYADMYVLAPLLLYVNSDYFEFTFGLTLSLASGITCTVILSSGSDVGIL